MKLFVTTQDRENYGSPDAAHWKNKGETRYHIMNVEHVTDLEVYEQLQGHIEIDNEMFQSLVTQATRVEDDWSSISEKEGFRYIGEGWDRLAWYDIRIDMRTFDHVKVFYADGIWYKSVYGGRSPGVNDLIIDHDFGRPFPHTF